MAARNPDEIKRLLAEARAELAHLDTRRTELVETIADLQREQASISQSREGSARAIELPSVTNQFINDQKTASKHPKRNKKAEHFARLCGGRYWRPHG